MLTIRPYAPDDPRFLAIVNRAASLDAEVGGRVQRILADIKDQGGAGLLEKVRAYDWKCPDETALRVGADEFRTAAAKVGGEFRQAIAEAAANIRRFHEPQIRRGYSQEDPDGVKLAKRVLPIARVGVYCPAGTAPLFSSLLMNVIPAQLAGVKEIAVAIPPDQASGRVNAEMLATAEFLGITEIYKMGGAQAIAAFAYGAGPVRKVDKIVGPGNAYVALAKRAVFGTVGIDSVAGPSELVVIADATARPRFIAADLLSQLEHGSGYESGVVLTTDRKLAEEVAREVTEMLRELGRSEAIETALDRFGALFICRDLGEAVAAANLLAPEHLEIQTAEPERLLEQVTNAGAVFLGEWSPEPVGDYFAGTNHVLPTCGAARFSSSLGVADFQKDISVINYRRERLRQKGGLVVLMAEAEGLSAHANAIRVRL